MQHQLSSEVLFKAGLIVPVTAAANNGAGVDCLGYRRAVAICYGKPTGSGTTSDFKVQESSDDGAVDTYADVTSATTTQLTTVGGEKLYLIEVNLSKRERYLRVVHTGAGGSAAGAASAIIALFRGAQTAPSQDNTVVSV